MSDEELTGKAKKAKRSEERFKKGKKRKRDAAGEEDGLQEQGPDLDAEAEAVQPQALPDGTDKKSKKRKRADKEPGTVVKVGTGEAAPTAEPTDGAKPAKRKKSKTATADAPTKDAPTKDEGVQEGGEVKEAKQRFIVFIGNLPFTTTTDGLTAHFSSITPQSIRHLTDPATKKSKGYAFLEFAHYDRMKTCLKLYHHSIFDSGVGGEKGKRRINVELTAGGGGKGGNRKEKLREKNERLEEQRKRRAEALAKQEKRKAGKKGGAGAGEADDKAQEEADAGAETEGMHPARLAMMNKPAR